MAKKKTHPAILELMAKARAAKKRKRLLAQKATQQKKVSK